jgi:hypothetical protein
MLTEQFYGGLANHEVSVFVLGVTGTPTMVLSGTYAGYRYKGHPSNSGVVFVSQNADGSNAYPMGAGEDTGWNPIRLGILWAHSDTADDEIIIWKLK